MRRLVLSEVEVSRTADNFKFFFGGKFFENLTTLLDGQLVEEKEFLYPLGQMQF